MMIARALLVWAVVVPVGCATQSGAIGASDGLPAPPPTVFIRVYGSGRAPAIAQTVTYRLCVDLARGTLVDVLDPGTRQSRDDQLANVLRGWKWNVVSSTRILDGVRCWRERFDPASVAANAQPLQATVAEPVHTMRLGDDVVVDGARDDDQNVSFIDLVEADGVRYAFLTPRIGLDHGPASARDAPGHRQPTVPLSQLPHLPDAVKLRFRGTDLTAAYTMCYGRDGKLQELVTEVPIDGANAAMTAPLRTWSVGPQPSPRCTFLRFQFHISR